MDDGSYTLVRYSSTVHYFENGKYKDIDNSIKLNGAYLENSQNSFKVQLPANYGSDDSVNIAYGNYGINFTLLNNIATKSKQGTVRNQTRGLTLGKDSEYVYCLKHDSAVTYGFDDVNLEYNIIGSSLKENIIINKPLSSYTFVYEIKCADLHLSLNEDGSISAVDNMGNVVFTIPAPYMFDASGANSHDVRYILEASDGGYLLTVVPDVAWLGSSDRLFPITIDPTITVQDELFVARSRGATNNFDSFKVSNSVVGFLKFNLPTLPSGATVTGANFNFSTNNNTLNSQILFIYECDIEWDVNPIPNAMYFDGASTILPDQQVLIEYLGTPVYPALNTVDITRMVKNWLEYGTRNTA